MAEVKIANRLAEILGRLMDGETLTIRGLAEEYGTSTRTIMRDLYERLNYLDYIKDESRIRIAPSSQVVLSSQDLQRFAAISGIRDLYPSLDRSFLAMLFDRTREPAYVVKGRKEQALSQYRVLFERLTKAIEKHLLIRFRYHTKDYCDVHPYKLINFKGLWYLAAIDQGKLKTFQLAEIKSPWEDNVTFEPDPSVIAQVEQEDTIWFGAHKTEVILKVEPEAAYYFKRRDLVPEQEITKELENGGLLISSTINHERQIIPIVQYWIPHVRIVAPENLQQKLNKQLTRYKV